MTRRALVLATVAAVLALAAGCRGSNGGPSRASGYVEATEVRVAPEVGGRVTELAVGEGDRVAVGAVIAKLDTADTQLAIQRAKAERDQAAAGLRLLQAGTRPEEIRQAAAEVQSAEADVEAAEAEVQSATSDLERFESLLRSNSGSQKQRDDAATRKKVAEARLAAARQRGRASSEALAGLKAGARVDEIAVARAKVAAADAQIASLEKDLTDAVLTAPVAGIVTSKLIDAGEIVAPRTPVVVITDLDRAWANVYVDEPVVPRLKLGQKMVLITDAGHRLDGTITFISPKAEFTPRNVQTAEERSRLVYRIKVTADNREGILKSGMPVEAELPQR